MGKHILAGILVGLLMLSGCSSNSDSPANASPSAAVGEESTPNSVSSEPRTADSAPDGGELLLLPNLIGKEDETVTETLGAGTVRVGTDGESVEAREYSFEILGSTLEVSAIYEGGVISHFDVYIPGLEAETWENAMIQWFGQPEEKTEMDKENSCAKTVFVQDNSRIVLVEAYETLSILVEPVS